MQMTLCPHCHSSVAAAALERLGGLCVSCLSSFVLEGEPLEAAGPELPIQLGSTFRSLQVLEVLGWGGMGVVYKCRQPELDRFVALKVLNPALASNEEFARRFNGEARALAALNHPNIVQIYDYGQEVGLCFLVMEYVDGGSLRARIRDGQVTPADALRVAAGVCDALAYAHSKGVIHRDIKPENILLPPQGGVKIADFGLAKMAEGDQMATRASRVLGTPHYVAPEILAKSPVDHRADVYSLGVVLYEMLTGEIPVGRFPNPSSHAGVDRRLDEIVLKALDRSPERRHSDTLAFKARLESVDLTRKSGRRLAPFVVAAAAFLAVIAGVMVFKPAPPPLGIARWNWVNRGDVAETHGTELVLPPYRDRPLITATPEGGRLGNRATLRFDLLYEIHPKDEPWIILMFDGPRADSENRAIVLFPEGDHSAALAHLEVPGNFTLLDLKPLPAGKPSPGQWHKVEASWDGDKGVLALKVDGALVSEWTLDGIDLSGNWKFAFGGAARSVRIREVVVKNTHKGI